MIGLKRGTVRLLPHQDEWMDEAASTIKELKELLGDTAMDIQHIGSTAIPAIYAKPIVDIVIGVRRWQDIQPYRKTLRERGYIYRGEDVAGQVLLVKGDFAKDLRTHHIHVVQWGGSAWNDYIDFRDYLNTFPEKAWQYNADKQRLAARFPSDRKCYTEGKRKLIDVLLEEAKAWRTT